MRTIPLLLVLLASCAQVPDGCDRAVTRELRIVERLVDETRTNLARGYAYETEESRLRSGLVVCSGGRNVRFCTGNTTRTFRRPVAIDPEAEERKLRRLEQRREALVSNAVICRPG